MIYLSFMYNNVSVSIGVDQSDTLEATVMDIVQAVDYAGKQGTITPDRYSATTLAVPQTGETHPKEVVEEEYAGSEPEEEPANIAKRKVYWRSKSGEFGITEKGDAIPDDVSQMKKSDWEAAQKPDVSEEETPDDTDPGDGVDEQAEEAGAEEVPEYTKEDVRNKVLEYSKEFGNAKAKELLAKYDAKKISDLDESDFAAIVKDADDELEL